MYPECFTKFSFGTSEELISNHQCLFPKLVTVSFYPHLIYSGNNSIYNLRMLTCAWAWHNSSFLNIFKNWLKGGHKGTKKILYIIRPLLLCIIIPMNWSTISLNCALKLSQCTKKDSLGSLQNLSGKWKLHVVRIAISTSWERAFLTISGACLENDSEKLSKLFPALYRII